jgi:hypothetical protein
MKETAMDSELQRLSVNNGLAPTSHNKIVLLSVPGDVQRGEMANLEIQGSSGVNYTATSTYRINFEKKTTYRSIVAPKSGIVVWNFKIDKNTTPGVYHIHVTGGGQEINTSYRVIE